VSRAAQPRARPSDLRADVPTSPTPDALEPHLADVLALLPDAGLALGADGTIRSANDRAEAMFGYGADALEGWRAEVLLPGLPQVADLLGAALGAAGSLALQGRRSNGVPFPVEATLRAIAGERDARLVLALRELGRDGLAGEAQRYFDVAFDDAPIGMALFDTDGRYVRVNAALCRILGRSADALLGRRDQEFTHPDDRQSDVDAAWEVLDGSRNTHQTEKRFVRPDGTIVWTLANLTFLRDLAGRPLSWVGQFQNITARREGEQALRRQHDLAEAILASMQDGYAFIRDGEILNVNAALCRLTGFPREELLGARAPFPFWPADRHAELLALRERLIQEDGGELELTLARRDGTVFDASVTFARAGDADGPAAGFVQTIRDISERKRHEQALERQATRDGLTGLLNRTTFLQRLNEEAARAALQREPLSLAILDVDHFKAVNDTHGHPAGDRVLVETVQRLRSVSRPRDHMARMGGEEFAWVLPGSTGTDALRAAERARQAVEEMTIEGIGLLTISVGVCELAGAHDVEDLYRRADVALYRAKAGGRNRCVLHGAGS
jgi:diguanylate cyclase (GGDEF)-like protein/PAS domain S-box-containing protein